MPPQRPKRSLRQRKHSSTDEEAEIDVQNATEATAGRKSGSLCLSFADEMTPSACWKTSVKKTDERAKVVPSVESSHEFKPNDKKMTKGGCDEFNLTVKPLKPTGKKVNVSSTIADGMAKPRWDGTCLSDDAADEILRTSQCQSTSIPDARAIHEARLRRRRMREALERGEIPLRNEEEPTFTAKSAFELIKGDASDESETEDKVIHFNTSVSIAAEERRVIRDRFLTCEQGSDESDESDVSDDRFSAWELEQIRKGVGIRPQAMLADGGDSDHLTAEMVSAAQNLIAYGRAQGDTDDAALRMPRFRKRLTLAQIQENIAKRIQAIEVSVTQYRSELKNLQDISSCDSARHGECREKIERNCLFLNALKEYAFDIRECMLEKLPLVDNLEQSYAKVIERRNQAVKERRRVDCNDQDYEFSCAKFVTDVVLNADVRNPVDPDRQQRAFQRENRRKPIMEAIDVTSKDMLSDCEDLKEESVLTSNKDRLFAQFGRLWEDVDEHFFELPKVLQVMDRWRNDHCTGYASARRYIPLTIVAPVVRCAAFKWNPLQNSIASEQWLRDLVDFIEADDKEWDHYSPMMEKLVLSILSRYASIYDPARTSQTKCLVSTTRWLFERVGERAVRQNPMFSAIQSALEEQINEITAKEVFIPLYPNAVVQHKSCGASIFMQYQFLFQLKLFRNIMSWYGILQAQFLITHAIEKIVNRCILLSLKCQDYFTVENAKLSIQVALSIPTELISEHARNGQTVGSLATFCQYLKDSVKFYSCVESASELCLQLKECLLRLNSLDLASDLIQPSR